MKLLFITQKVDRADWLLGFTHGWLKSLAARVEQLIVICLEQGETDLPANVLVISLGKERGVGRFGRMLRLGQALAIATREVDGIFAHMSPAFAVAAAPFAKVRRLPLVLWYTHRNVSPMLRLATALCDTIVTASPESFQLPTKKVRVLGHGIDVEQFAPAQEERREMGEIKEIAERGETGEMREKRELPLILAVGRLSPIKRYELLIEAVKLLRARGLKVGCAIAGIEPPGGKDYGESLRANGEGVVDFLGAVPHAQIAAWYHRCSIAVNLCPTGGLDKAVLEAMFCARPVLVTNRSFESLLGMEGKHWLVAENAAAVAEGLAAILADPAAQPKAEAIRARAVAAHGLEGLMERLAQLLSELSQR